MIDEPARPIPRRSSSRRRFFGAGAFSIALAVMLGLTPQSEAPPNPDQSEYDNAAEDE